MKVFFVILSFVAMPLFAGILPQNPSEIEVIKKKNLPNYENIPRISKQFKGERNNTNTDEVEAKCQQWVFNQLKKKEAPYFKVWCTREVDVIMREYIYTGNLLIKNW